MLIFPAVGAVGSFGRRLPSNLPNTAFCYCGLAHVGKGFCGPECYEVGVNLALIFGGSPSFNYGSSKNS